MSKMAFDLLAHLGAPSQPPSFINRYVTSHILHPFELAALRLLLSFYAFFTIFYSLGYESTSSSPDEKFSAQHFLSYFTNLCYWGLAFYFLFAGLHGMAYHFTQKRRMSPWQLFELERWPRGLQAAHAIFYSSVVVFAPLVTIVFWSVIYRGPFYPLVFDAWRNISVHALNTAFAVLEILLPRTLPLPPLHLPLLILILLLYLGLAYLTHAISHFYVYTFLNTTSLGPGTVTGYCIAILAGVCVVFGFVWALIWLKASIMQDRPDDEDHLGGTTTSSDPRPPRRSPLMRRTDRLGLRHSAHGTAGMREQRSGAVAGTGAASSDQQQQREQPHDAPTTAAAATPPPPLGSLVRPSHTRSVSGITIVNDEEADLESGPAVVDTTHVNSPTTTSTSSPRIPRSPRSPRGVGGGQQHVSARGGETIELDAVTSEFIAETGLGRGKVGKR